MAKTITCKFCGEDFDPDVKPAVGKRRYINECNTCIANAQLSADQSRQATEAQNKVKERFERNFAKTLERICKVPPEKAKQIIANGIWPDDDPVPEDDDSRFR